jgi:hypothetical protein
MLRVDTIAFLDVPVNVSLSGRGQEEALKPVTQLLSSTAQ